LPPVVKDESVCSKWIKEQLIPSLRLLNMKCVTVMENAPYHSVKIDKPPTMSSKKENLQKWLKDHNIHLLSLKNNFGTLPHLTGENWNKYEIHEILKAEGHEVLRLPPYNCQYNLIELAWADCKDYYNKHIPSQLNSSDRVKKVWREALQQCTKQKWQALETRSQK
jgi:transposase